MGEATCRDCIEVTESVEVIFFRLVPVSVTLTPVTSFTIACFSIFFKKAGSLAYDDVTDYKVSLCLSFSTFSCSKATSSTDLSVSCN